MNKKETQRIATMLQKYGIELTHRDGDILWFATIPYNGLREYRDTNGTLVHCRDYYHVDFEAGVNKAGVGDGKKPDVAITYSIGVTLHGCTRRKGCRYWDNDAEIKKFYFYDRHFNSFEVRFVQKILSLL